MKIAGLVLTLVAAMTIAPGRLQLTPGKTKAVTDDGFLATMSATIGAPAATTVSIGTAAPTKRNFGAAIARSSASGTPTNIRKRSSASAATGLQPTMIYTDSLRAYRLRTAGAQTPAAGEDVSLLDALSKGSG